MLERILSWLVNWLNGGKMRVPNGTVLPVDECMTNLNERRRG
jgi:hypothetical protein